jgi:hypothetical protein
LNAAATLPTTTTFTWPRSGYRSGRGHFEPRIHRVLGVRDHSALTVTVADTEGLVAAINEAG